MSKKDWTVIELVDRLMTTNSRMTEAESNLEAARYELATLKAENAKLKAKVAQMEKDLEENTNTISHQYDRRVKLEQEIEKLKAMLGSPKEATDGDGV